MLRSPLCRFALRPQRGLVMRMARLSGNRRGGGGGGGGSRGDVNERNKTLLYGLGAIVVTAVGLSYAAVPLYRMFCSVTGYGGTTSKDEAGTGFNKKAKNEARPIRVRFNTDVSASLPWTFRPLQQEVTVVPGATMLAFFRAKNNSDYPVVGVSTYNVQPSKAGQYFVKIQCFCFEEQRLAPHEEVDMPVFFYIDPDMLDDPKLDEVESLVLSYSFFLSKGRNPMLERSGVAVETRDLAEVAEAAAALHKT